MAASSACAALTTPALPMLNDIVDGYVLDEHIGFQLRRAHQRHASLFNEAMAASDLTPTQFAALIKTVQLGRVTQNHLGRLTAMDPATIQGVVRRLIERGFITRDVDPMDRRSAVLAPTQEAVDTITQAIAAVRDVAVRMLAPLSPAEQTELFRLLAKIA